MAINIETNITGPSRGLGRLGHLLRDIIFRTREDQLIPRGFVQIQLTAGGQSALGNVMRSQGRMWPPGVRTIVVNVEGAAIRYCDADTAAPGYGELYGAGSSFSRTFRTPQSATFAADSSIVGTATINISLYGEPQE